MSRMHNNEVFPIRIFSGFQVTGKINKNEWDKQAD